MTNVRCPMCGKPNPEERDVCQYCGARLKPVVPPATPVDSQTLKPGNVPVRKDTSEFEKVRLSREAPIHPGEAPTKKDTAELERALPSWLRSLREGDHSAMGGPLAEPSPDEEAPTIPPATPAPDSSSSGLPDWLSGLGKTGSKEEEAPDWLAEMRGEEHPESKPAWDMEEEPAPELGDEDWLKRLGSQAEKITPTPADTAKLSDKEIPATETSPTPPSEGNFPDWLQNLQSPGSGIEETTAAKQGGEKLPDWLSGLPGLPAESPPPLKEAEEAAPAESMPAWMGQPDQKPKATETSTPAEAGEPTPDWLSNFGSIPESPSSTPTKDLPDWLSDLEAKSGPESGTSAALLGSEPLPTETPDWLSQLQAEASAVKEGEKSTRDSGSASETPASQESAGSLPDWLADIEQTTSSSKALPALVADNQGISPGGLGETALPLEKPDWLSKLNPGLGGEKAAGAKEGQGDSEKIEAAELPSWVRALRPVEAVVESKTPLLDESQVTEQTGPLAGLRGVLPAGPGLGLLRKPRAYASKLQVSETQQRYAASLEQLVAGESQPRVIKTTRLPSNRLWRWGIAVLLILAVGLPFVSGARITPGTLLSSTDKGATPKIIDGLPANVPVLVAFDYDPALAGELEVVAAPILDHLLSKGTPLALISTSPTGPALAEHFLQTTSLVNVYQYQSENHYVNLGYLTGGPAGMSYLADSLRSAVPLSVDGKSPWESGPLQNIQNLSDFAAVIVLTDNADTGRNWVEQIGSRLGNTPLLMIISAQAEPMVQPYFDSGQLKGLVSGLMDAKVYEQQYDRPGLADHYWSSLSLGMLVAELLILAGAILGVMADRRATRKDAHDEV